MADTTTFGKLEPGSLFVFPEGWTPYRKHSQTYSRADGPTASMFRGHARTKVDPITEDDLDRIVRARAAGYQAAVEDRVRAPAMCPTYRTLIVGLPVGRVAIATAEAFLAGYQKHCDEQAALILILDNIDLVY